MLNNHTIFGVSAFVEMLILQQKIDEDVAKMKAQFSPDSGFFSAKHNVELIEKAIRVMSEMIVNNHYALHRIRKLQDTKRDAATNLVNLNDYVPVSAHNELLKSYENLMLSVKEEQRMNNEKDRSLDKLRKQCTSMHKENRKLRADNKALELEGN